VHLNIVDHTFYENEGGEYNDHHMETMLSDAFRYENDTPVAGRNVQAEAFYNMLESAQQLLYEGCTTHSELSATMRLLNIKS